MTESELKSQHLEEYEARIHKPSCNSDYQRENQVARKKRKAKNKIAKANKKRNRKK